MINDSIVQRIPPLVPKWHADNVSTPFDDNSFAASTTSAFPTSSSTTEDPLRLEALAFDDYDYVALILSIFPLITIFGNILVIAAVYQNRSLQNATNYFIVSLAVADLLVGAVVEPFAIYIMVRIGSGGVKVWEMVWIRDLDFVGGKLEVKL